MVSTATQAETKTRGGGAMDLIGKMASGSSTGGKKKSGKPQIREPELNDHIESFIANKQKAETAQALADAAKDQIVQVARQRRLEHCVKTGAVIASIGVNGRLTFTQQKRYCKVPEDRADALRETFGERADRYFKPTLRIALNEDSANDEDVLNELVEKLGGEFFAAHFEVKRDLVVTEAFHNDYSTNAGVQDAAEPFIRDETIKPFAPALKVS